LIKNLILLIVGQSGAGKTYLSKKLSMVIGCPLLIFSEIGAAFGKEKYNCSSFAECFNLPNSDEFINELNYFIYSYILEKFLCLHGNVIVIDGLVSIGAIRLLKSECIDVKIFYLNTPYELRIERIMKRLGCSHKEAEVEEQIKFSRKNRLGIDEAIKIADHRLDGSKQIDDILDYFFNEIKICKVNI